MVPDLLIFLGILLAALVILQLLLRRKWVRERAEVLNMSTCSRIQAVRRTRRYF